MDLDLTVLDETQLDELQSKVSEQLNLRLIAGQKDFKEKFLKSKKAQELAQKIADLKSEFKSMQTKGKVKIEVELEICLKAQTTAEKLFSETCGSTTLCDLFEGYYSFKLLNDGDFSKKASQELRRAISRVLEDACLEAVELDKNLKSKVDDFVVRLNSAASKIDDLECEFDNVESELEKLLKKGKK
jgi:hypothetical protein